VHPAVNREAAWLSRFKMQKLNK